MGRSTRCLIFYDFFLSIWCHEAKPQLRANKYVHVGRSAQLFPNILYRTASRLPVFPGYNGGLSRSSLVLPLIPWEAMVENGKGFDLRGEKADIFDGLER